MLTMWIHREGDRYLVTGYTVAGRPFRREMVNPYQALGINLYRGRVWLLRDGRRRLVKSVWN